MKQYNRIMLGEHGMYLADCLEHNYIGINVLKESDLTGIQHNDESAWRVSQVVSYVNAHPEKSAGTARNLVGFLWTICYGLNLRLFRRWDGTDEACMRRRERNVHARRIAERLRHAS